MCKKVREVVFETRERKDILTAIRCNKRTETQRIVTLPEDDQATARPWVTRTRNSVKIGSVVPEICSRTDTQTDKNGQTRSLQYSANTP